MFTVYVLYSKFANKIYIGFTSDIVQRIISPYAWRVNYDVPGRYLRYECNETVHAFEVYMARWDNSPVPTVLIRYSLNSGTSYTNIDTVVGGDLPGDKVYQLYFDAVTFSTTQNNLSWRLNGNGDAIRVSHQTRNITIKYGRKQFPAIILPDW